MARMEWQERCRACGGTGLYVGMAERDGAAVVCRDCRGTGCFLFAREFEPYGGRQNRVGVVWVYEANPGICLGGADLASFGGMSHEAWQAGATFSPGTENRAYTCPAWWYQAVDHQRKPHWGECEWGRPFSECPSFATKDRCWRRWDEEFGG